MSACFPLATFAAELPQPAAAEVNFDSDIRPILERSCLSCHGAEKQRSGFRLDQRSPALKGGELGVAIVPGKSAESPLIRMVAGLESGLEMPPKGDPLTPDEIGKLRRWIDDGAHWSGDSPGGEDNDPTDWWSLKPLVLPAVPRVADTQIDWVSNPIDAFILSRLNEAGLIVFLQLASEFCHSHCALFVNDNRHQLGASPHRPEPSLTVAFDTNHRPAYRIVFHTDFPPVVS